MKIMQKLFITLLLNLALATSSFAGHTPEQAKAMVEKAIAYIKANGPEKAYKEFSTPGSPFIDGELYVFVIDYNNNMLAHGGNPKLVGRNMADLQSADGKFIIKELTEAAKSKGEGWVDYQWANPTTKKISAKTSFVKQIPGTNTYAGCGIYK